MPGLIEDYAIIGNCESAALVGRQGSIARIEGGQDCGPCDDVYQPSDAQHDKPRRHDRPEQPADPADWIMNSATSTTAASGAT